MDEDAGPNEGGRNSDFKGKKAAALSPKRPMVVRLFRALKHHRASQKRHSRTRPTEHELNERVMARWTRRVGIFTVALAVSSVVADVIIFNQLKEMHSGGVDTHALAAATASFAKSMSDEAQHMGSLVQQTQRAYEEDDRAWVSTEGIRAIYERKQGDPTDRIQVTYNIVNRGKDPALNVAYSERIIWFKLKYLSPTEIDMRAQSYPRNDTCSMRGSKIDTLWSNGRPYTASGNGARPTIPDFYSGKQVFLIQGCVKYETFSKKHFTRFCELLTPELPKAPVNWAWSLCQGKGQQQAN